MTDLKLRIDQLVGRLVGGRDSGTERRDGGSHPALRSGDAGFAEPVAQLVAMPIDQYARKGAPLEVQVPWLSETVWFVADDRQAEVLALEGVSRGRVWTARELIELMALPDRTREVVQGLALAKRAVDGDIVEVRR